MSEVVVAVWVASKQEYIAIPYKRVHVRKSLDEICHSVEVEITDEELKYVHKHGTLQVRLVSRYITEGRAEYTGRFGYHPVTTVYIDEVRREFEDDKKHIIAVGRSRARDIIDSKWSNSIFGNPTLLTVLKKIASEVGMKEKDIMCLPTNRGDITSTLPSFSWENESPWAKLLTAAEAQGFTITSNQLGGLYIEKASGRSAKEWGFGIEEGVNTKRVSYVENGAEQFHEYIVNCCSKVGKAIDDTCPNKRKLTINLTEFITDQEQLNRRAKTEMLRRREARITCSLSGWGLTEEQIKKLGNTFQKEIFWEVNLLIPVKIPSCNMNANMLISQVEYSADSNSLSCDVTLVKPEAYR